MIREAGKIDRTTVLRSLLIILLIVAAQQTPWPGAPDLQATVPFLAGGVLLFGFLTKQLAVPRFRMPKALACLLLLGGVSALLSPVPWIAIPAFVETALWIMGTVCLISVFLPSSTRVQVVLGIALLVLQQVIYACWQLFIAKVEVTGTLGTPNALARFAILSWPLLVAAAVRQRTAWVKVVLAVLIMMTACLVVLSGSRLAVVAFILQAGYVAGRRRPRTMAAGALILSMILLVTAVWGNALRDDDMQRVEAWRLAADLALRNPLTGTGSGTFALYFRMEPPAGAPQMLETPHNLWFRLACETGLLSIPLFVWLILAGWRQLNRLKSESPDDADRAFIPAVRAIILGMLVLSLAEF